jgi:hypothetical protein
LSAPITAIPTSFALLIGIIAAWRLTKHHNIVFPSNDAELGLSLVIPTFVFRFLPPNRSANIENSSEARLSVSSQFAIYDMVGREICHFSLHPVACRPLSQSSLASESEMQTFVFEEGVVGHTEDVNADVKVGLFIGRRNGNDGF